VVQPDVFRTFHNPDRVPKVLEPMAEKNWYLFLL